MFSGSYIGTFVQFLTSKGGKALFKEVLPAYVIIIFCGLIYCYMERSSLSTWLLVLAAEMSLPIIALIFMFFLFIQRAIPSSRRLIRIESRVIIFSNLAGIHQRSFTDMLIHYVEGSHIDFIDKNNIFNGYAMFGDLEYLESVLSKLSENGFTIIQYPQAKRSYD